MMHGLENIFLYSAVKILTKCSNGTDVVNFMGTGFFIAKDTDYFFVTNRHVAQPGYRDPQHIGYHIEEFRIESFTDYDHAGVPCTIQSSVLYNWSDFKFHSNYNNDIACIKNPQFVGGLTVIAPLSYSLLATKEWINNKLCVCDSIAYPGFPQWYDKLNNTPIFRMGTIASDPRRSYANSPNAADADCIAYEGVSSGGASGSPVFATQRAFKITVNGSEVSDQVYREAKLIGINAGHLIDKGKHHSGISYMYKASAIHDIIDTL